MGREVEKICTHGLVGLFISGRPDSSISLAKENIVALRVFGTCLKSHRRQGLKAVDRLIQEPGQKLVSHSFSRARILQAGENENCLGMAVT